jgi:hypothetical protein
MIPIQRIIKALQTYEAEGYTAMTMTDFVKIIRRTCKEYIEKNIGIKHTRHTSRK